MFGLQPTDAMTNLTTLDSCLLLYAAQGCVNGSRFDALHGGPLIFLAKTHTFFTFTYFYAEHDEKLSNGDVPAYHEL